MTTNPATKAGAVLRTRANGCSWISPAVKMRTAAPGGMVRPKLEATATTTDQAVDHSRSKSTGHQIVMHSNQARPHPDEPMKLTVVALLWRLLSA